MESHAARGAAAATSRRNRFAGRWQLLAFFGAALVSPVLAMAARERWGFLIAVAVVLVEMAVLAALAGLARQTART